MHRRQTRAVIHTYHHHHYHPTDWIMCTRRPCYWMRICYRHWSLSNPLYSTLSLSRLPVHTLRPLSLSPCCLETVCWATGGESELSCEPPVITCTGMTSCCIPSDLWPHSEVLDLVSDAYVALGVWLSAVSVTFPWFRKPHISLLSLCKGERFYTPQLYKKRMIRN